MRIHYNCDSCGEFIDVIEVEALDEAKFGFDCLTPEERQALVRYDDATHAFYVQSLCDACIEALGLGEDGAMSGGGALLH